MRRTGCAVAAHQRVPPRRRSPFRFDHGIMCAAYCRSRCSCPYPAHPSPPPQPSAAPAVLSRKRYFGSQYTSFMAAVVRAACASDGTFADNSRLTCLRSVNNFLCLRTFQIEAAFQAQEFLAPLVSSATCANAGVRSEWVLLLRNMASALHSCRPDGFEQHTHYIAALLLQILHAPQGPHLSSSNQLNGTLGLGTCLHILKTSLNGIEGSAAFAIEASGAAFAAFAVEAKAALSHVESGCMASDSLPTGTVAREALQLLNDIAAAQANDPNRELDGSKGVCQELAFGISMRQGGRDYMEDVTVAQSVPSHENFSVRMRCSFCPG